MKSVGMFLIGSWKPESPTACTCGADIKPPTCFMLVAPCGMPALLGQ